MVDIHDRVHVLSVNSVVVNANLSNGSQATIEFSRKDGDCIHDAEIGISEENAVALRDWRGNVIGTAGHKTVRIELSASDFNVLVTETYNNREEEKLDEEELITWEQIIMSSES